ncbi:Uncharacterized protein required for formate dehydrogenase activity, partial [Snodgrassella alvi SCGC AB-598-O02]
MRRQNSCGNESLSYLSHVQQVGKQTGCTHAAVWLDLKGQFIAGFEDIGRHVALDKLLGFRAMQLLNNPEYQHGVVLVSSRASYEMVQKTANCGVEFLLAVSAATSMAVDLAKQCNLTGFSLTENIIHSVNDIYDIDVIDTPKGIEVHIELSSRRFSELKEKRRNLAGRTGCGICGTLLRARSEERRVGKECRS